MARFGSASDVDRGAYRCTTLCSRNEHRSIADAINHGLIIPKNPFVSSEVETRCAKCLNFARHERIELNSANSNFAAQLHRARVLPPALTVSAANAVPREAASGLRGVGGAVRH